MIGRPPDKILDELLKFAERKRLGDEAREMIEHLKDYIAEVDASFHMGTSDVDDYDEVYEALLRGKTGDGTKLLIIMFVDSAKKHVSLGICEQKPSNINVKSTAYFPGGGIAKFNYGVSPHYKAKAAAIMRVISAVLEDLD